MKKNVAILLLSIALAILSGCGQPAHMPYQPKPVEENVQWRTEDFDASGKPEEEEALWAGKYLPWAHKSQASADGAEQLSCLDSGVCGELFWYFGREPGMGLDPRAEYVLEIYDTVSGQSTVKRFTPAELGLEGDMGALYSMDMLDEEHYVFQWVDYEQNREGMYCQTKDSMVYTDLAGSFQVTDFRESFLEKEFYPEELTEQPQLYVLNWCCDGKGNICVVNHKESGNWEFVLFDQNGEILLEYEGASGQQMVEPLRAPDGELILPVYDGAGKCYEFLRADTVERQLRSLARVEASYPDMNQMYGMLGDDIYYRSQQAAGDGIVRWNIESGQRVWVFDFRASGIDRGYQTMLALREGQSPVLRLIKNKGGKWKEWLSALEDQKPADDGAIRVADLTLSGESKGQVEACTVLASMEMPGFHYEYEDATAPEQRDRIMAELTQGKGPDLLFVSLEDLYLLEEKGLLMEMGELIPGELQEELLPGALEIGTVDGQLLGVPVAVRAETLVTAADTWQEDTWRLEDVIGLMEEGKLTGAIRNLPHIMMGRYTQPSLTVLQLVNYSLADSFLIDWENRKCHFDDERFIRLLELTGTDLSNTPTETDVWLNGGKDVLWGYFAIEPDFLDFFARMEKEGGQIVGFPTEGNCGSYLMADGGVLVVNANIVRKEAAVCFLEILLGEELQAKKYSWCMSVRKLSPEDYIVEDESGRLLYMGDKNREVPVLQDGATSLHRAKEFLESCVAPPPGYSQISRIIAEEISAMYAEGKSPEATAEIINSRVQLYLDEGK